MSKKIKICLDFVFCIDHIIHILFSNMEFPHLRPIMTYLRSWYRYISSFRSGFLHMDTNCLLISLPDGCDNWTGSTSGGSRLLCFPKFWNHSSRSSSCGLTVFKLSLSIKQWSITNPLEVSKAGVAMQLGGAVHGAGRLFVCLVFFVPLVRSRFMLWQSEGSFRTNHLWVYPPLPGPSATLSKPQTLSCLWKDLYLVWLK